MTREQIAKVFDVLSTLDFACEQVAKLTKQG
jgi:hypothetical protein